jgi:hypothetical protein
MKNILFFFVFLLVGTGLVFGYRYLTKQQTGFLLHQPKIATAFSLKNAPRDSLKGKIATMSGSVTWLSRVATRPVTLSAPGYIQQGESLGTGKNGKAGVVIQNSGEVILTPDSHVNFIQMLPVNIVLDQDKGVVIYENTGQNAMSVQTLDLITSVNGALAVISLDQKTNTVTITVEKGSVTEGYEDLQNNSNVVNVPAGNIYTFDDTTRVGTVTGIPGVVQQPSLPFGH